MKRSYAMAAGLAVIAVAWVATGSVHSGGDAPPEKPEKAETAVTAPVAVRVRTLQAEDHAHEIVVLGRTKADRSVVVKAQVAGRVATTPVAKGARVKEGGVLVAIAVDDRRAQVAAAEAELKRREIAYDAAKKLSQKAYRSKVKLAEEKALLDQARAALTTARLALAHTSVKAPFDGILDDRAVEVGDYRKVGEPVVTVVDLDPIVIAVEVAEREIGIVTPGTPVTVRLVTGKTAEGVVRFVSRASENSARTYRAEIAVPNPDASIPAGMTAEVRMQTGAVRAHRISPAVLTLDDDGVVGLKVVDDGGIVRFIKGELVADTPEGFWVGGLPNTARVITVGQEYVKVGQKVTAVEQDG